MPAIGVLRHGILHTRSKARISGTRRSTNSVFYFPIFYIPYLRIISRLKNFATIFLKTKKTAKTINANPTK